MSGFKSSVDTTSKNHPMPGDPLPCLPFGRMAIVWIRLDAPGVYRLQYDAEWCQHHLQGPPAVVGYPPL